MSMLWGLIAAIPRLCRLLGDAIDDLRPPDAATIRANILATRTAQREKKAAQRRAKRAQRAEDAAERRAKQATQRAERAAQRRTKQAAQRAKKAQREP